MTERARCRFRSSRPILLFYPSLSHAPLSMSNGSSPSEVIDADKIAETVFSLYASLRPPTPLLKNGHVEWTILASICLLLPPAAGSSTIPASIVPISLSCGTKTLPYSTLRGTPGDLLRDAHAEVLARRAGRSWLAERLRSEVRARREGNDSTALIDGLPLLFCRKESGSLWSLSEDVKVCWYVSTLPCGACSMGTLERRRREEDEQSVRPPAVQSKHPESSRCANTSDGLVRGHRPIESTRPRLHTIPGRGDSPPSLSHCCTDKLLQWSLLGWQGSALCRLMNKINIDVIVVGVEADDWQRAGGGQQGLKVIKKEIERGLDVKQRCSDEAFGQQDTLAPPQVHLSTSPFRNSRHTRTLNSIRSDLLSGWEDPRRPDLLTPSWEAGYWIASSQSSGKVNKMEWLVGGAKRGSSTKRLPLANELSSSGEQRLAPIREKSRARICRLEWFRSCAAVLEDVAELDRKQLDSITRTYGQLKGKGKKPALSGAAEYRCRKAVLRGETINDSFSWEEADAMDRSRVESWMASFAKDSQQVDPSAAETSSVEHCLDEGIASAAPLKGWLVTPRSEDSFGLDGSWLTTS